MTLEAAAGDGGPLISVLVPTRNSAALLRQALQSLAQQSFRDFEVIVSDGASTDGTQAIAASFAAGLPSLRVDSRPDTGVYDAINRGVSLSRGTWFLVLGSDDCLHSPDTLATVAAQLGADEASEMVYGDVRMMSVNLCGVLPGQRFAGEVSLPWFFTANICQQGVFYRRSLHEALGGFNERYRLYADWDFNLRAMFRGRARWIDVVVADYAATGMSATSVDEVFVEDMPEIVRAELLRRPFDTALWPAQKRMRVIAKRLRKKRRWGAALVYWRSYFYLLALRTRMRLTGAPPGPS